MDRAGKCLCGAVQFTAKGVSLEGSACHCGMCRRWAGGPWISLSVTSIDWQSEESLQVIASSKWAERGFCTKCGSSLFYRVTAEGKYHGMTSVSFGTFEDQSGVIITKEWFIDKKPDAYTLAGDRQKVTEAEVFALFGGEG